MWACFSGVRPAGGFVRGKQLVSHDAAPFAARRTPEQRAIVEERVPDILDEHFYEMYILPEELLRKGGEANPLRKLGLAPL